MSAGGATLLRQFKERAGDPRHAPALPVGAPPIAILRPVATHPGLIQPADVAVLTEWRNKYVTSFLTEFAATAEQTTRWLTQMVGPDDTRILFMVDDPSGQTIGYMGLAFIDWERHYVEADAIVRGRPAPPGTMMACLKTLLGWAKTTLGLPHVHVRVRSDNPAVEFYRKLGFTEERRVPLRKTVHPGKISWVEDPAAASPVQLVYMTLDSNLLT